MKVSVPISAAQFFRLANGWRVQLPHSINSADLRVICAAVAVDDSMSTFEKVAVTAARLVRFDGKRRSVRELLSLPFADKVALFGRLATVMVALERAAAERCMRHGKVPPPPIWTSKPPGPPAPPPAPPQPSGGRDG